MSDTNLETCAIAAVLAPTNETIDEALARMASERREIMRRATAELPQEAFGLPLKWEWTEAVADRPAHWSANTPWPTKPEVRIHDTKDGTDDPWIVTISAGGDCYACVQASGATAQAAIGALAERLRVIANMTRVLGLVGDGAP